MGAGLFQPGHLILILLIALIVFGPGKLPELGSALGQGIREFKRSVDQLGNDTAPSQASAALSQGSPAASGGAEPTSTLSCSACQAAMPTSARFCTRCGQRLEIV